MENEDFGKRIVTADALIEVVVKNNERLSYNINAILLLLQELFPNKNVIEMYKKILTNIME